MLDFPTLPFRLVTRQHVVPLWPWVVPTKSWGLPLVASTLTPPLAPAPDTRATERPDEQVTALSWENDPTLTS